ncbi:MAG TPA: hypothetical protein VKY85_23005 [Candidatus Angelobacter sp.]|nr:hypothetical protein [Candidatus Angelobacter sp.]
MIRSSRSALLRRVSAILLWGLLTYSPLCSWGQTAPSPPPSQSTTSLGDSLQRAGNKQLHIFYVHGIGSDGPGDYDSWSLRRAICVFVKDCATPAGELDEKQREYADQDKFSLSAPPPALEYLGQRVWRTPQEWSAAAPYVVHWKLARSGGPTIYVDEINWWPLVFSLKCRQIVRSDAQLVGPSADRIKLCSTLRRDPREPDRFISFDWIPADEAPSLLSLAPRGALVNRKLKNGVLNWGFSDAILALGPLRAYLLDGIRQLILKSVDISMNGSREGPATLKANQEYVIVSHSLGSYLIFAALDINPAAPKTETVREAGDAFEQILARTSLVYFFANQLRLLELASLAGPSDQNLVSHLEAWGGLRCDYLKSLPGSIGKCAPPQIVALNDPSDLLTWTVPELSSVEVHNVVVKNAPHWFRLFENPTKAHDNYAKNKNAIEQMLKLKHE